MEVAEATNLPDVSRTALTEQRDFGQGDILDMQRSGPLTLQGETNIAGTITKNENIYNDNRTINTNKTNVGSVIIQANFSSARDLGDTTRKAVAVGGEGPRQRNRGRGNVGKRKRKQAKAPYNYKTAAQKRGRPPPDIPGAPEQTFSRLTLEWMFENKGKAALLIMVLLVVTVLCILVVSGSFKSGTLKHDDGRDISSNTPGQVFRQPDRATSKDETQSTILSATYTSSFPLHTAIRRGDQDTVYDLIHSREAADINQKDNAGNTPLHIAASMGSQRLVNTLISKGAKVNAGNHLGKCPLHEACRSGHLEVVQVLCEHGADVNVEDIHGASPLTEAMLQHIDPIFYFLLDRGANIDAVDTNTLVKSWKPLMGASRSSVGAGSTPLHIAAQLNGSESYVATLLKRGAKPNVPDSMGWNPLHTAAFQNRSTNVLQLLKNNARVDALTKDIKATALCLASQEGHLDVVVILLSHGAHVNHTQDDGASALFLAAQSGHTDVVDTLLKHGANINVTLKGEESTPLCMAVQEGHAKVVNKILEHDKMKHQSASSAMCLAAFSGHLSVVKALLDHGAGVDAKNATANRTPLVYACQEGHLSVVRYLLDHGADISGKGKFTPLALATYKNHSDIVGELAQRGANVNVQLASFSMLGLACVLGYAEVAAILIDYGAPLGLYTENNNLYYKDGLTYLMTATLHNHAGVVKVLIDRGADVNIQKPVTGETALFMAASNGSAEVAKVLLQHGARPDLRAQGGVSPLHQASLFGYHEVVEQLLSFGEIPHSILWSAFYSACRCNFLHTQIVKRDRTQLQQIFMTSVGFDFLHAANDFTAAGALMAATALGLKPRLGNVLTAAGNDFTAAGNVVAAAETYASKAAAALDFKPRLGNVLTAAGLAGSGSKDVTLGHTTAKIIKPREDYKNGNIKSDSRILEAYKAAHEETVRVFLRHGVDVNVKDDSGSTALHEAVSGENLRIVQLLVEHGADVNARNAFTGRTALDDAMNAGLKDIADYLKSQKDAKKMSKSQKDVKKMSKGQKDVNARNAFTGRTALDDAMNAGLTDIVDYLKRELEQQKQKKQKKK